MWKQLGTVAPGALTEARLQAHWAAQPVSAVGAARLPAAPDFSHTNLGWDDGRGVLAGRRIEGGRAAALRVSTLTLEVGDARYPLHGHTFDEAMAWLAEHTGGERLSRPEHDLPAHAVGEGGRFAVEELSAALGELAAWFSNASGVLDAFAAATEGASAVRCWPHHFDLATLVTVGRGEGEDAKSVGVGLSPGDGSYDQPYFYATPWPYPADPDASGLPALPAGGRWHTQGWFGAVLPGEGLVGADDQQRRLEQFIAGATSACRAMLE